MEGIATLTDKNGKELQSISILKLKIKSEEIVKKSMEIFHDNDPCIIHYTYCSNYIAINLLKHLNLNYKGYDSISFLVEDIPNWLKDFIVFENNIYSIRFK